jgi:uncharacterized membrane protein
VPSWLLTIAYWLHMAATVAWLGGLFFSGVILNPVISRRLDARERLLVLEAVRRRFDPIAWMCLAILVATGLTQMSASTQYQGALAITNRWSQAILGKHLAVGLMILAAGYQTWFVRPRLERMALLAHRANQAPDDHALLAASDLNLDRLNLLLSLLVLALTAIARTA